MHRFTTHTLHVTLIAMLGVLVSDAARATETVDADVLGGMEWRFVGPFAGYVMACSLPVAP